MWDNNELTGYIEEDIQKTAGICFPVRSSVLRRVLTKKVKCTQLHPNPDDEFCKPGVGPCWRIISDYQKKFITDLRLGQYYDNEPLIVERIHPGGYMIVNGHHRWAAAMRIGQKRAPVQVVNLMHEADVEKTLANSTHEKRAALDLDEVVFQPQAGAPCEAPARFPRNMIYKERLRLGIPALFHFLAANGYDIWLYSRSYYSADYIERLFKSYRVRVTGVISAMHKRRAGESGKKIETAICTKYAVTLHIDRDAVLRVNSREKTYSEAPLAAAEEDWSRAVMAAVERLEKEGSK